MSDQVLIRSERQAIALVGRRFEEQGADISDLRGAMLTRFHDYSTHEIVYRLDTK